MLDPHLVHVTIRWIHVLAMAAALGGALTVLVVAARAKTGPFALDVAIGYEWVFWASAGVLAMTGIGNLAVRGEALPIPGTDWGTTLLVKLAAVIALVVVSLPRSLAVARMRTASAMAAAGGLRALYGGTTVAFAVILGLAIWLAHG